MRRFLSVLIAVVVLTLGFASTQVRAGDLAPWGILKEWHDANGEVIGGYYKPCPGMGEISSWGVQEGRATVSDRWSCDLQPEQFCTISWYGVLILVPCE